MPRFSDNPNIQTITGTEIIPGTSVEGGTDVVSNPIAPNADVKFTTQQIRDYAQGNTVTALSIVSGVVTVNLALGDLFTLAMTENVTDWVFTNKPGAGKGGSIWIEITQAATPYTVAVPTPGKHTGGEMPVGNGDQAALAMTSTDNWTTAWSTFGGEL